jgi:hypothetical protein
VEAYFTKLKDYLATQKPTAATVQTKALPAVAKKTAPAKKAKPAAKTKTAKPATRKKAAAKPKVKPKPQYNTTPVERIDSEVAFIRRYAAMNGKVICRAAQSGFCQFERIRQK